MTTSCLRCACRNFQLRIAHVGGVKPAPTYTDGRHAAILSSRSGSMRGDWLIGAAQLLAPDFPGEHVVKLAFFNHNLTVDNHGLHSRRMALHLIRIDHLR